MGSIPMMGMGGTDDFYTQMMYAQMMNGGGANGAGCAPANWAIPSAPQGGQVVQPAKQGGGLFNGLKLGAVVGLGTAGATYFTNTSFTSPVETVNGRVQFTDDFMAKFSGEYAAMKNGTQLDDFIGKLGTKDVAISGENFACSMDSLDDFIRSGNIDDLSDGAKAMLQNKFGFADVTDAKVLETKFKDLHTNNLDDMKSFLYETNSKVGNLTTSNNLNATQNLLNSLDDIGDNWKALGAGAESKFAKLSFLKENAHALGIQADDYKVLLQNADDITDVKQLDDLFTKYGASDALKARRTVLGGEVTKIKNQMQNFARQWGDSGLFGVGGFKKGAASSKTLGCLDDAYKSFKLGKAGKYGLIAAGVVAGLKLFDII